MDAQALFLSQLAVIKRATEFTCSRHRLAASEAEEFTGHVMLKLVEDDYGILRKFQSRSRWRTYLTVVIQRLFLDWRTHAWGKWRPSAEASRRGEVAILLERLVERDGYHFDEACDVLTINHQLPLSRSELDDLRAALPTRVRRRYETDSSLASMPANDAADRRVTDRDTARLADRLSAALSRLLNGLGAQDRLLLTLRFEEGATIAAIARKVGAEPKGVYCRFQRLLRQLREGLEREGLDAISAADIMDLPTVRVDWMTTSCAVPAASDQLGLG